MRPSILFAFAASLAAQVSSSTYREEGACPQSVMLGGDRMEFRCTTIPMMIGVVYGISPDRITGPDWITAPRYDAAARSPEGLQPVVRDSFHLRFHRESVTRPVLALIPSDGGMRPPMTPRSSITVIGALPATAVFYGPTHRTGRNCHGRKHRNRSPRAPNVYDASSITARGLADLLDYIHACPRLSST